MIEMAYAYLLEHAHLNVSAQNYELTVNAY